MKNKLLVLVIIGFLTPISCKKSETSKSPSKLYDSEVAPSSNGNNVDSYHIDSDYKYEHRSGSSGNYEYNYDVNGQDSDGNDVDGNVDMNGRYGSGTITDVDGNERDVEVEWVGYGEMEATDDDGNTYSIEAE